MSIKLLHGDCLELMKQIPDRSVDLVLTDPPYNIGHAVRAKNRIIRQAWDDIPDYINWSIQWLTECQRVLKPNGVLYFFHNDITQIAELLCSIKERTNLDLQSFCVWDKGEYFAKIWKNRKPDGRTALRSWFNVCEYCLHFFNAPKDADVSWKHTGLDRINSNPACYKPLKEWYASEKARLGLTDEDICVFYTKVTGRKPYMVKQHYFQDSQFELPTQRVWETVYMPLGFSKEYEALRKEYEALRKEYEALRKEYEALRNIHHCDENHCNIWHIPSVPSGSMRLHSCQKPVEILERLVRVSSNPGGTVLDCFMGSGSTGVACLNAGRNFIGIEKDDHYFNVAQDRLRAEQEKMKLIR